MPKTAVAKAHRVVVTEKGGDPADRQAGIMFRPAALQRDLAVGELAIPARDWARLIVRRRCIDATLRRCFPWPFVIRDLIDQARTLRPASLSVEAQPLRAVEALELFRPSRCAPICEGKVEVYRRTCCCRICWLPPYVDGPTVVPFPELFERFEVPTPFPAPGPSPDPAPFALQEAILTGGAVDVAKLDALRQAGADGGPTLARLAASPGAQASRPAVSFFPLCRCGAPVKVADGFVGEGGSIHLCWSEPLRILGRGCHDEFSFVVRQSVAGSTVTIYDGPGAGQWFDDTDDITLTSYHPRAVGCREGDFPVPVAGAFVVLQDIGTTESHRLRTPLPDGADSVQSPTPGSGLLDVDAGPDYALGANLHLRYEFSEIVGSSMKALGARYFRVQWATANTNGDPVGSWETLPVPAWKTWQVVGTNVVPGEHSLGPNPVGAFPDLFHIPFETGGPLLGTEEWQDGQFHAHVPTESKIQGSYLVRIEVFDAAGNPAGAGHVTFHLPAVGHADHDGAGDLRGAHPSDPDRQPTRGGRHRRRAGPGREAGDCKFFTGPGSVTVRYRAYHPQAGDPSFMLDYDLSIHRGISGTLATPTLSSTVEVGEGPVAADHTVTIADLLDGEARCSFAVGLRARARIHTGSGRRSDLDRSDIAAFAVQAVATP